jgi:DNA-directed RNA polymerase subunit RPC12/RpoP
VTDLYACKKCSIVNATVEVYYYEEAEPKEKEYLCMKCQKQAFHFFIRMLIIGSVLSPECVQDPEKRKKMSEEMSERVTALSKKNRISSDYTDKAIDHEINHALKSMIKARSQTND